MKFDYNVAQPCLPSCIREGKPPVQTMTAHHRGTAYIASGLKEGDEVVKKTNFWFMRS